MELLRESMPMLIALGAVLWGGVGLIYATSYHLMLRMFQMKGVSFRRSLMEFMVFWFSATAVLLAIILAFTGLGLIENSSNASLLMTLIGFGGILGIPALIFGFPVLINRSYKNGYGESLLILFLSQSLGAAVLGVIVAFFFVIGIGFVRSTMGDELDKAIEANEIDIIEAHAAEAEADLFLR
jgi:hypothetical protein